MHNQARAHSHHHHHCESAGRMLWIAAAITLAYAGVEAGVGWWAGSLALVADAGHMVNDAGALSRWPPLPGWPGDRSRPDTAMGLVAPNF